MNGIDLEELQKLKQIEAIKKEVLGKILTKEAYERLARIRTVNPEFANQVDLYLLQIYQAGKIQERITDGKLKEILKILSEKKSFRIKRK